MENSSNFANKKEKMYAILFDLDTDTLSKTYKNSSYQNAYYDIANKLKEFGFNRQQGSVYFGMGDNINAVSCVLAAQKLAAEFEWFKPSIKDIRMLKIEDDNDLLVALNSI